MVCDELELYSNILIAQGVTVQENGHKRRGTTVVASNLLKAAGDWVLVSSI